MKRESLKYLAAPRWTRLFGVYLSSAVFLICGFALFLPWTIYSKGSGRVTSFDPNERIQSISAPVTGFVSSWSVKEGNRVNKGDVLVEMIDQDPTLLERISSEKDAALTAVEATQLGLTTAKLNLERQRRLLAEGLSSDKDFERAKIEVTKHSIELSKARAILAKAEVQVSRQKAQTVVAPRAGTVMRILSGEGNQIVKSGDPLLIFAPDVSTVAVEAWISGSDIWFVEQGQPVRVEFDGWPSVQVSGWPSVAIGTFTGRVELVDFASSQQGRFRVLITPDSEPWPSARYLKLNSAARAIIFLSPTRLGFEVWRKLNNYPPPDKLLVDELSQMLAVRKNNDRVPSSEEKSESETEKK